MMNGIKDGSNMCDRIRGCEVKLFDYKAITAVRRQYTPHIYTLYISPNMWCTTYSGIHAKNPYLHEIGARTVQSRLAFQLVCASDNLL